MTYFVLLTSFFFTLFQKCINMLFELKILVFSISYEKQLIFVHVLNLVYVVGKFFN